MRIILKTTLIIPKGTVIPKEIMYWVKANCVKYDPPKEDFSKYDLPEGFEALFGGFRKQPENEG